MSLVKAALAKAESQFISVHDVVTRICKVDGCTCQEAATMLHRLLTPLQDEKDELWKLRENSGVSFASFYGITSGMNCLRRVAGHGIQERVYGISNYNDQHYGLDGHKIAALLLQYGIDINSIEMPINGWPQWKCQMAQMPFLNEVEAASAFADVDLNLPGFNSYYDQTELERHVDIIVRNIEAKRIEAEPHTDSRSKWRFTPEALAEWCATQGISYPLPIIQGLPTTDSGLRRALAEAKIEIARLEERIVTLENENAKLQASPEPLPDFEDTRKTKGERQEAAVLYWINLKKIYPASDSRWRESHAQRDVRKI